MLTPDTDTYITVVETGNYFESLGNYPLWESLAEKEKEQALRSAAIQLDMLCKWSGEKVAEDQPLEFPRVPDAKPTPEGVKLAQADIAYLMMESGLRPGDTSGNREDPLTELKAGSVQLKFEVCSCDAGKVNPHTNDLIQHRLDLYGRCKSGGSTTTMIPAFRG